MNYVADWNDGTTDRQTAAGIIHDKSTSDTGELVFVFTGQGAQWWKMGRELYSSEPVFRDVVKRVDALLHRWQSGR